MKNRTTAALLAFLLGGIGIHHFYLGNNTAGILSILFCWTFIPAIVAFVNVIQLIVMSDEDFNAKYNGGEAIRQGVSDVERLAKLHELHKNGGISEEEYESQKKKLLV